MRQVEGEAFEGEHAVGRVRLVYKVYPQGGRSVWGGTIHADEAAFDGIDLADVTSVRLDSGATVGIQVDGGGPGSAFTGSGAPPHKIAPRR